MSLFLLRFEGLPAGLVLCQAAANRASLLRPKVKREPLLIRLLQKEKAKLVPSLLRDDSVHAGDGLADPIAA